MHYIRRAVIRLAGAPLLVMLVVLVALCAAPLVRLTPYVVDFAWLALWRAAHSFWLVGS